MIVHVIYLGNIVSVFKVDSSDLQLQQKCENKQNWNF